MKDIIAKLGITPGPWQFKKYFPKFYHRLSSNYDGYMFEVGKNAGSDNAQYDKQWEKNVRVAEYSPEMLEALIEEWIFIDNFLAVWADTIDESWYHSFNIRAEKIVEIIENGTGLKWEKVKEIIE
jgi:hypothetical protein